MRNRMRILRGTPVFIYSIEDFTLIYVFDSKQQMYSSINIHHNTLQDCLETGKFYLDSLFLSLDEILESPSINLLSLEEIKTLVKEIRLTYNIQNPTAGKSISAVFKDNSKLNKEFSSITELATYLKGDRGVIRGYLKGTKLGYYRGKWKFLYKN